jgi:hypothetical protein
MKLRNAKEYLPPTKEQWVDRTMALKIAIELVDNESNDIHEHFCLSKADYKFVYTGHVPDAYSVKEYSYFAPCNDTTILECLYFYSKMQSIIMAYIKDLVRDAGYQIRDSVLNGEENSAFFILHPGAV